jgi:hypothetical protein
MSKNFLSRTQASRQAPVHRRYDANQCETSFFFGYPDIWKPISPKRTYPNFGGGKRIRTDDPLRARQVL